jgi:hypothetical protein
LCGADYRHAVTNREMRGDDSGERRVARWLGGPCGGNDDKCRAKYGQYSR